MSKKKQRKKLPITSSVNTNDKVKFKQSRVETARLIRRFHVLNKELAKCRKQSSTSQREQEILQEMEAMGGLDWYQKASQLGQSKRRGGDSSKWLIQTMKERLPSLLEKIEKPLHVLDVGAVAPDNYKLYKSWIHARAIDLNPQHQDIEQQDFLKMKPPEQKFDILCLSLVINFVGDPRDRGKLDICKPSYAIDGGRSNK
ncbi:putative methyltransferase-domain-containing protein [Mycotypha africana]|uniref:putative methyltransferase-domain-containing protein n=1 Tax=Mycotypha africana TaxID=64632 RepID=UPI0023009BFB|nr:putative methyltransferase-domain-containing protein [Mycotypha africana]KAI8984790.1 putative methyltransferase-domain-containing protein [Mycotypha africana]